MKKRADLSTTAKIRALTIAAAVMLLGLVLFKYLPMKYFGPDITFDASFHITLTIFILYIVWYFIDQNPTWHTPFFLLSAVIVTIVAFQRLLVNAHSDFGIILGIAISLIAIAISRWKYFHTRIDF